MILYGSIGSIAIAAAWLEKRCRDKGNTNGALAARRFGGWFLAGAGGWIVWEWIASMIALLG